MEAGGPWASVVLFRRGSACYTGRMAGKKGAGGRGKENKGGCLGKLAFLFVVVLLAGFGALLLFIAQPQDTSDIGGYGGFAATEGRDLKKVLENSVQRGHPLLLKEAEINGYLKRTLKMRQAGHLGPWVDLKGVAVRTEDGRAEVVIERVIAGRPFTVSMYLSVEQQELPDGKITTYVHRHGGRYLEDLPIPLPTRGGRFGRVVVPQGFLLLVLNSFERVAALYEEELRLALEEMARIRIEENGVMLDPRPGSFGFPGPK